MKTVNVEYFAFLREKRGVQQETVGTDARTIGDLYVELREKHALALPPNAVKAIVSEEFVSLDSELSDGATVAFLPPVAGG